MPTLLSSPRCGGLFCSASNATLPAGFLPGAHTRAAPIRTLIFDTIREGFTAPVGRQTLLYFSAQLVNSGLGLAGTILLTHALTVSDFGTFSIITTLFLFLSIFIDFGLFSAGSRLLALAEGDPAVRSRSAAIFLRAMMLGAIFTLCIIVASFFFDGLFHTNARNVLLLVCLLAFVFPMQEAVISACRGANRIRFLSLFTLLPRAFHLLFLLIAIAAGALTLATAVLLLFAGLMVSIGIAVVHFSPRAEGLDEASRLLKEEIRIFGRQVYLGRIVDGLTNGVDRMLIASFFGVAPVAFYSIAQNLSSPISLFSRSLGAVTFRDFATIPRIPTKILAGNLLWCLAGGAALVLACVFFIPILFPKDYSASLAVLPWLAVGNALAGLNVPYHTFLSARGMGRAIKVMSVTTSLLNVGLMVILVPFFSVMGAAVAFIAGYLVNIIMNLYYYRSYCSGALTA